MARRTLIVDGNDLSEQGFTLTRGLRGIMGTPVFDYPSERPPGRIDAIRLSTKPEYQDRTLLLPGVVDQGTRAALRSAMADLAARLSPGEHTFRFVDDETVEFVGLVREVDGISVEPDLTQTAADLTVRVQCLDPRLREVSDTVVAFTTATDMPLGNAPVRPVIRITGSATNPTVTYKDSGGTTVTTLGLTVSIGAGDWVEVDCAEQTIVDQAGASHPEYLTSGTFIELDPTDGDYVTDTWPTLEVDSGDGQATYRKRWWAGNG